MTNVALNLQNAIVLFGQFPALSGVNLEVKEGEKVVITGVNGAGKTTLLRLLAGLVRISSGAGEVLGVDLTAASLSGGSPHSLENLRSNVGLVGTKSMLYEDLSPLANLKFWVQILQLSTSPGNERGGAEGNERGGKRKSGDLLKEVKSTLNYLQLDSDCWKQPVRQLSTGQRRRVVLALQILKRPRLWLLDEPHAGLDKQGRQLLDDLIKNAASSGATVVIASHETDVAGRLADRSLELSGGRFK